MKFTITFDVPVEAIAHKPTESTFEQNEFLLTEHMCVTSILESILKLEGDCKCGRTTRDITVEFTPEELASFKK